MATVLTPPTPAPSKQDARVEQELRKVAGRIRLNDVLVGAFALAVVVLGYATAGVVLDRWLELPAWARQFGLGAFALTFAAVGYLYVVRPLRRTVNPRFAARQVEATAPEAKNAVINWVDLHDKDLPEGVRRAVGTQAAQGVAVADTTKAAESRSVVWLGGAAGLLVAVLAVLFVVLKPAPFLSLLGRTFNPFSSGAIATRTVISLTEPKAGDATVTSGDTFVVAAYVDGSVPGANGPDRVRLQVRYNPESPEYDEIPLDPGTSNREWQLRVPQHVIQNGFWYRVAGGDGRTPEYRLAVRSRPLVRVDHVRYEYPAYTRIKPEEARDPMVRAYRGTQVTLTARTNRPAKGGWMQVAGQKTGLLAEVVGDGRDTLRFTFKLTESGSYLVGYTTDDGDAGESPQGRIDVLADQPPTPTISTPADEEVTRPANGLLEVDGAVGDDFGIESVALVVRVQGDKQPLLVKKYRDGQSLKREADGTLPMSLEYKDSVPLASLNTAEKESLGLAPGTVLEYWLEAADNCTEPRPNVGRSAVKRVKLTEPEKEQPKKEGIAQQRQQRRATEDQHQKKQDEEFRNENRDPKQLHPEQKDQQSDPQNGGQDGQPQAGDQTKDGSPKKQDGGPGAKGKPKESGTGQPDPMNAAGTPPEQAPSPKPMDGQPNGTDTPMPQQSGMPADTGTKPPMNPDAQQQPGKTGDQSTEPKAAGDSAVDQQAQKVNDALNQQNQEPGQARSAPETGGQQPDVPPADPKTGPKPDAAAQPESKPESKSDGMAPESESPAAESKAGGTENKSAPSGAPNEPMNAAGQERPGQPDAGDKPPTAQERAGDGKGSQPTAPSAARTTPKSSADRNPTQSGGQPNTAETKSAPKPDGGHPMNPDATPSAPKPEGVKPSGSGTETAGNDAEKGAEKPVASPDKPPASANRTGSGGPSSGQPKTDPKELEQAMRDLAGTDEAKKQAARDKLDRTVGKDARQRAEQLAKDMNSADLQTREKAKQQAGEISRGGDIPPPPDEKVERLLRDKAQDLASNDPKKREAAEKEIDQAAGKQTRDELQKAAKGLNSSDPAEKQSAQQKVDELAKKSAQDAARKNPKPENGAGQNATGSPNDQSQKPDPAGNQGAERKQAGSGKPSPEQMKELAQKANDLNSPDAAKREAAEKEFDKLVGEQKRKDLQQDLASGDAAKQKEAQDQVADLGRKQGGTGRDQPDPKDLTPEQREQAAKQLEQLRKDAEGLASKDEAARKAAEKKFDDLLGQQNREQLQKDMEDLKSGDPNRQKAAQDRINEKLDQMAKDGQQPGGQDTASDRRPRDWQPGGSGKGPDGVLHKDDPKNRLKSGELQLAEFEKNRHNKALHDRLQMTQEEYDRFLDGFRRRVDQMRAEVEKAATPTGAPPTGPATVRVGEGTGGQKLANLPNGAATPTGSSGPGTAPPGFTEAQRRFAEEAAKLRRNGGSK